MAVPSWPAGVPYVPDLNSIQPIKRALDPIRTEMDGGNVRLRRRPGDNVGVLSQTVRMSAAQYDSLLSWLSEQAGGATARFTMPVRLVQRFETKVCQFNNGAPTARPAGTDKVDVAMQLRVYDV